MLADIGAYQLGDPDPDNADADPDTESTPNGLALLGDGRVLIADAANNDLLLVDGQGQITTVARLKPEAVPFAGGTVTVESVPTAVGVSPDGAYYVSELKGVPFPPGTAPIWRIAPGSVGATCDRLHDQTGPCKTIENRFSSVIDVTFGPDATMYVLEIGLFHLPPPFGALWAVKNGTRTEIAPGDTARARRRGGRSGRSDLRHDRDGVRTGRRLRGPVELTALGRHVWRGSGTFRFP